MNKNNKTVLINIKNTAQEEEFIRKLQTTDINTLKQQFEMIIVQDNIVQAI